MTQKILGVFAIITNLLKGVKTPPLLKVHFVVQKTAIFVTNSHFLWQDFFDKNQNKKKLQKGKWKLTNLPRKTYKYLTNSVFDRVITKPFSNNHTISSFKFETDFYLRRVFCARKCNFTSASSKVLKNQNSIQVRKGKVYVRFFRFVLIKWRTKA